jgi:signal peptidase II
MEPAAPSRTRRMLAIAIVAVTGLAIDLASKQWAWETLRRYRPKRIIKGVLHLELAFNTGAAFGVLGETSWARFVFVAITVASVAYVLRLGWRWPLPGKLVPVAMGMLVGGALGNLHDRLLRTQQTIDGVRHGVVDFIVIFYWPKHRWPAFNVADVLLLVGMVLFAIGLVRARKQMAEQS